VCGSDHRVTEKKQTVDRVREITYGMSGYIKGGELLIQRRRLATGDQIVYSIYIVYIVYILYNSRCTSASGMTTAR
jgi:hypothetical protein